MVSSATCHGVKMYVPGRIGTILAVVIVLMAFDGCDGAPRPCPQFLPVAVRIDPQTPTLITLKTSVKVKDEKENVISKKPEGNLEDATNDLVTKKSDQPKLLPILDLATDASEANKNVLPSEVKGVNKSDEPKLLQISEISTASPEANKSTLGPKPKKRRRLRPKPKEPKRIILNVNSNWALKTINDKPAAEVLMTDKASVARDLKDSTESALVTVRQLKEKTQ